MMTRCGCAAFLGWLVLANGTLWGQETYYLPQVADGAYAGGSIRTTFVLFNPGITSVTAEAVLTRDDGSPLAVDISGLGPVSQFTVTLGPGGSRFLQTGGNRSLTTGAARVSVSAPIAVSAVFSIFNVSGAFLTEAGVGASRPSRQWVLPVDSRDQFSTGVAFLNPDPDPAVVSLVLMGLDGQEAARLDQAATIPPGGHLARFVCNELFPALTSFQGTLAISSSRPVAALTLRLHQTPLNYTTLPAVESSSTQREFKLPQVANGSFAGGSIRTTFILFNLSGAAAFATLTLTKDDGTPFSVNLTGAGTGSSFNLNLPPGGSVFLETDGAGTLSTGAARIVANVALGVTAIFSVFNAQGAFQTEAGVGDSEPLYAYTLPVDRTGSFDTGVALFNTGTGAADIHLRLLDATGNLFGSAKTLELASGSHVARFVSELFSSTAGFRGTLAVSSSAPLATLTLRLNPTPLGYTTLPVASGTSAYGSNVTGTIGAQGGSLSTGGFTLTAPAGAFAADVTLSVKVADDGASIGDAPTTAAYLIGGMPVQAAQPIQVRIPCAGPVSDEVLLACRTRAFVSSRGGTSDITMLLPATYADGFITAEIPAYGVDSPPAGAARPADSSPEGVRFLGDPCGATTRAFSAFGLWGYKKQESAHFRVYYRLSHGYTADKVSNLAGYLEEAYTLFRDRVKFSYSERTAWPVQVNVYPLDNDGQYTNGLRGNNYGFLEIDSALMNELPSLRLTAGHEFCHLVESLYDPRGALAKACAKPVHHWLNEAVAVYFERSFSQNPLAYIPANFLVDGDSRPFVGMQAGNDNNDHGYGIAAEMSSFVRTLSDQRYNLVPVFERLKAGLDPVEAIVQDDPNLKWWWDFWESYVTGNIYGVGTRRFIDIAHDVAFLDDAERTTKTFEGELPDLSARLYFIRLNHDKRWPWQIRYRLTSPGISDLRLYTFQFSKKGSPSCEWSDLQMQNYVWTNAVTDNRFREADVDMALLVVNGRHQSPYTDSVMFSVDVDFVFPIGIENAYLGATADVNFTETGADPYVQYSGCGVSPFAALKSLKALSLNEYQESWDWTSPLGVRFQGNLRLTFDPVTGLMSGDGWDKRTSAGETSEQRVTLEGVPHEYPTSTPPTLLDAYWLQFSVHGADSCAHIKALEYQYQDATTGHTKTATGYSCNDQSSAGFGFNMHLLWPTLEP